MNKTIPPIPIYEGHWLLKSTRELMKSPIEFYENRFKELGETFYFITPWGKVLMTANPELVKYVLQTNHKNYDKDPGYEQLALLLGKGLVTSKGEFWKKQRRIAQPAFYKKSLGNLFTDMVEVMKDYLPTLEAKKGQVVDISKEMMALTAKVAMQSLFSRKLEGDLLDIYKVISFAQKYAVKRGFNPLYIPISRINGHHRRFLKQKSVMDKLITNLIEERRKSEKEYHDLLQMLLDARYEDTGEPMEHQQLMDELITMFSAGHETSANGLAWTMYLLAQHPEVVKKIRAEVEVVLGDELPSFENIRLLQYTKQVVEEGMRLYPPVWTVGRITKESDSFQGIDIPKNTPVMNMIWGIHRNPAYYENPLVFNPDRFAPEIAKKRPRHHFIPFAIGPRMCIGNHFAMMEMQLILPILIKRFDFELVENQKIELEPLVTLRPKYGVKMKIKGV